MNIVAISVQVSDAIQVLIKISDLDTLSYQWLIVIIGVVNNMALERCYDFCSDNIFTTFIKTTFILATFVLKTFALTSFFPTTFVLITY